MPLVRVGEAVQLWERGRCYWAVVLKVLRHKDQWLALVRYKLERMSACSVQDIKGLRDDQRVSMWQCRQGARWAACAQLNHKWEEAEAAEQAQAEYESDYESDDNDGSGGSCVLEDNEHLFVDDPSGDVCQDILEAIQSASYPPAVRFALQCAPPEWLTGRRRVVPPSWCNVQTDDGEWVRHDMYEHSASRSWARSIAIETAAAYIIYAAWQQLRQRRAAMAFAEQRARVRALLQPQPPVCLQTAMLMPPRVPTRRRRRYLSHELADPSRETPMLQVHGALDMSHSFLLPKSPQACTVGSS